MKNNNLREEINASLKKSIQTIRDGIKKKITELERHLAVLDEQASSGNISSPVLHINTGSTKGVDLNFIGTTGGREHVEKIAKKCHIVLRKMATENLLSKHEIPKNIQQVFDVLIETWSHEFPGRRFAILCVQSGMPWTGPRHTLQLYTWKHLSMRHITGGLQTPSLPHYPRQNIKTKLGGYDCHMVEITKHPQIGESLQELSHFSRGKDVFLYGVDDLYRI